MCDCTGEPAETDVSHRPFAAATQYVAKSPVALRIRDTVPGSREIELLPTRALEQEPRVSERRRQMPPFTLGQNERIALLWQQLKLFRHCISFA